jgi:hypothetical protein
MVMENGSALRPVQMETTSIFKLTNAKLVTHRAANAQDPLKVNVQQLLTVLLATTLNYKEQDLLSSAQTNANKESM